MSSYRIRRRGVGAPAKRRAALRRRDPLEPLLLDVGSRLLERLRGHLVLLNGVLEAKLLAFTPGRSLVLEVEGGEWAVDWVWVRRIEAVPQVSPSPPRPAKLG